MKYQSGFVPVQFYKLGKIIFIFGIVIIVLWLFDYFFNWDWLNNIILYLGIVLTLVGLYLRKFAPKDESE